MLEATSADASSSSPHPDRGPLARPDGARNSDSVLDRISPARSGESASETTLAGYIREIARLGGYLGRSRDPPPGIVVLWRGLSRLVDIERGIEVATRHTYG